MITLFVVIPLGTAFFISLIGRFYKRICDILANLSCLSLAVLSFIVVAQLSTLNTKLIIHQMGNWVPPFGICFAVDSLSILMLITVNVIAFLVCLFSVDYMEKYTDKWKFYTLFLLMLAGLNGVASTGDIFNLFVWFEIAAIASYALVAFGTEHEELEAAFKYAVMSSIAALFILIGIGLVYSYTSTLNLADIAITLSKKPNPVLIGFICASFIFGFGLKSALVPFHSWLPDAHPSAPAPMSAMLSGVFIKVLGVYALARVIYNIIGVSQVALNVLICLGAMSMAIGVALALYQWDYKRLLAYHSVSQIGYMVLGLGLGTPLGIIGGIFHLMNHAAFKSLLFLTSGAVEYATGTRDLKTMAVMTDTGLGKKMPVTNFSALTASMSISGIPPFNGFWSKLVITLACIQSGRLFLGLVVAIVSLLTLASFTKLLRYAFYGKGEATKYQNQRTSEHRNFRTNEQIKEVPFLMQASMVILSILCITMGLLLLPQIRDIILTPAIDVLTNGVKYGEIVFESILR